MVNLDEIIEQHHGNNTGFSLHYLTLYSVVLGMESKRVLELGAGFSTVAILEALEKTGGSLITCDTRAIEDTGNNPDKLSEYKNWTYLKGNTLETVPPIKESFDVVLHDGSHEFRTVYKDLRNVLPKIKNGGLLLVHDTAHKAFKLNLAVNLALLFKRHEKITLPYGYGLTIVKIKSGREKISLSWHKK